MAASSLGKLETEIHVDDVRSAEGGSWRIFLGTQSSKPANIVRTDYGEMGQTTARLVIAEPDAYAIILTDGRYDRPMIDPAMKIASSTS